MLVRGQALGGYIIEQRLGAGGMGEVWRARDPKLARAVALKVLSASGAGDPELRARFVREARAAASFAHPSIVTVFGAGEEGGVAFLAMELVDGSTLRAAAVGAPIATRTAWLRDLAGALAAVHRAGFVHRDVKPTNVMVTREGVLKLLDFGLTMPPSGHPSLVANGLTETGALVGTPRYLAPEQWNGARATAQADQFAWGLVAFEILSGVHPDDCSVGFGRLARWAAPARPLRTRAADVPDGVANVVDRALARSPDERFESMDEAVEQLGLAAALGVVPPAPPPRGSPRGEPQRGPRAGRGPIVARRPGRAAIFVVAMLVLVLSAVVAIGIAQLVRARAGASPYAAPAPFASPASGPEESAGLAAVPSARPASSVPAPSATVAGRASPPARRAVAARPSASSPPTAPASGSRPGAGCAPGRSLGIDVDGFDQQVDEPSRIAWLAAARRPLEACVEAMGPSRCVGDTVTLFARVEPGRRVALDGVSTFRKGEAADPSSDCLLAAASHSAPEPKGTKVRGTIFLTVEP